MSDTVSLELIFIHETPEAILVKDEEDGEAHWLAKSDIEYDDSFIDVGMVAEFDVRESAAIECGFV